MQPHWTLHLSNGLKVNVPADLDNPVTLTLLEYEAWPEPEHAFLRQLIQPGMRLLDADTGLGLDALAMAQGLSGAGQVTALNLDPLFARSVADNGLQALIQTPKPKQTPDQPAPEQAAGDGAFDLIRLGAETPLDPRWLPPAEAEAGSDPLIMLPSTSPAITALRAAGLDLYRLIPALNALVAVAEETDEEKAATRFACRASRAARLRELGRLIRSA
ncbi:methyltransferase domain-containing protein [Halochromatium sp.]